MEPEQSSTENIEELIASSTLSNSIQINVSGQFESNRDAQALGDACFAILKLGGAYLDLEGLEGISVLVSILNKPSTWTMIVFASSVQHAEILACLLTLSGVPSACITGQTQDGARADAIEKFRMGTIRVLTNYNVLTQGFDAPAVRALYVARPTFSANLYQQMIGRGLRGPLNGGKEECLIVNIEDNMIQYGTDLAFHSFAHLWSPPSNLD